MTTKATEEFLILCFNAKESKEDHERGFAGTKSGNLRCFDAANADLQPLPCPISDYPASPLGKCVQNRCWWSSIRMCRTNHHHLQIGSW